MKSNQPYENSRYIYQISRRFFDFFCWEFHALLVKICAGQKIEKSNQIKDNNIERDQIKVLSVGGSTTVSVGEFHAMLVKLWCGQRIEKQINSIVVFRRSLARKLSIDGNELRRLALR